MKRLMRAGMSGNAGEIAVGWRGWRGWRGWWYVRWVSWMLLAAVVGVHVVGSLVGLQLVGTHGCTVLNCVPGESVARVLGVSPEAVNVYLIILVSIFPAGCLLLSIVIMWQAAHERMAYYTAWMLVAFGGTAFSKTDRLTFLPWWAATIITIACLGQILFFLFFYLFPDGHFVPRWTRYLALLIAIWIVSYYCWTYVGFMQSLPQYSRYTSWLNASLTGVAGMFLISVCIAQIYRYRYISGAVQRRQAVLVVVVFVLIVGVYLLVVALQPLALHNLQEPWIYVLASVTLISLCLLLIPIIIGVAILRDRLWNIRLIGRTLVYSALSASIVGLYLLIVGILAAIFQASNSLLISLIASGCVAVLFQPLRVQLQRNVNRLLYGERDNPSAVLTRLAERLETVITADRMPQTIVETVAQALKLPYAALQIRIGEESVEVASYGHVTEEMDKQTVSLVLSAQQEQVGELILVPRGDGETFSAADTRLLREFAIQAGLAVQAVRLSADLQHSRERLVLAREEERRRIRRDLHDGLAPTLAALALGASILPEIIESKPGQAVKIAKELEEGLRTSIGDIRRLVYDLRPPTLDELGLVAAIQEYVQQQTHLQKEQLEVRVEVEEALPVLPAALEVAVLRIVQEAFMNVLRHAEARHCWIILTNAEALQIEIIDDGSGISSGHRIGVGLLSMRERAAELGGNCQIEKREGRGTRICARLPLSKEERADGD